MIWCTYIGKAFCHVWTHHKLVNSTKKLQFGVMVTEKSFWDKKLPLFVESPICRANETTAEQLKKISNEDV